MRFGLRCGRATHSKLYGNRGTVKLGVAALLTFAPTPMISMTTITTVATAVVNST